MLTQQIMGLLALGILWVNGLLVVAVALKQLAAVNRMRSRFARARGEGRLIEGVVEGDSPIAVRRVEQLGRARTDTRSEKTILFTDGAQSFEVLGGRIQTADGAVEIAPAPDESAEVWVATPRAEEAAACPSEDAFDEAWGDANKYKGHRRDVSVDVRGGDRVWVVGAREGDRVLAPDVGPLLLSMVEPFAWARSKAWLLGGFVLAASVGLAAVTALALWRPWFGTVSTIGGVLCVAYFLGIQPLGTAVRDAVRTPARQPVNGTWQRS